MAKKQQAKVEEPIQVPTEETYNLFQACNIFRITGTQRQAIYMMVPVSTRKTKQEWEEFLTKNRFSLHNC